MIELNNRRLGYERRILHEAKSEAGKDADNNGKDDECQTMRKCDDEAKSMIVARQFTITPCNNVDQRPKKCRAINEQFATLDRAFQMIEKANVSLENDRSKQWHDPKRHS